VQLKPELTKRQIKANETRDRIYQTALELLETQGYETIRIEDICQKAGVSIGSFYNYFSSKNDIL
jgi:AcrR family transcriptional regulator